MAEPDHNNSPEIREHLLHLISEINRERSEGGANQGSPRNSPILPQHDSPERGGEVFLPSPDELISLLQMYRYPCPVPHSSAESDHNNSPEIREHLLQLISEINCQRSEGRANQPSPQNSPIQARHDSPERGGEVFLPSPDELISLLQMYRYPSPVPSPVSQSNVDSGPWSPSDSQCCDALNSQIDDPWSPSDSQCCDALNSQIDDPWSPSDSQCCDALNILERGHQVGGGGEGEQTESVINQSNEGQSTSMGINNTNSAAVNVPAPCTSDDMHVTNRERFNNVEIRSFLRFPPPSAIPNFREFYLNVTNGFRDRISSMIHRADVQPNDVIQVNLRADRLQDDVSMSVRYGEGTVSQLQELLDRLVQSNMSVFTDGSLELIVNFVKAPRGGGKRRIESCLASEIVKKKARHLFVLPNPDQTCFAVNLALLTNPKLTMMEAIKAGWDIHTRAGLTADTMVTFDDVVKFEELLACKIVIFYQTSDREKNNNLVTFQTGTPERDTIRYLLLHNNHFYGINNIKGFLGVKFFCKHCHTGYQCQYKHFCEKSCNICCTDCKQGPIQKTYCADCNRFCTNRQCYERHREKKWHPKIKKMASMCQTNKTCPRCKSLYYTSIRDPKEHTCAIKMCTICKQPKTTLSSRNNELEQTSANNSMIESGEDKHVCYMRTKPIKSEKEIHEKKIVFFDFETSQTTGTHLPVLVVAQSLNGERRVWKGHSCALKFLLHFRQKKHKQTTFISHFGKGFDHHIILNAYVTQGLSPSVIAQGSKIILILDNDFQLKFIDSFSFIPIPLRDFSKALGCKTQLKKGYFPHRFTDLSKNGYRGSYPPAEMYSPDEMSPKQREDFLNWYQTVKDQEFDYDAELVSYCENDVEILAEGASNFRNEFIKTTDCDPFDSVTIASAALNVFQTKFLKPNTIAIPCPNNYKTNSKAFSHASIQWLEYEAFSRGISIRHALNGGEVKFGRYSVDGYGELNGGKVVFEFLGCYFHGCPKCYMGSDVSPLSKTCFSEVYSETLKRLDRLQNDYKVQTVVIKWEHEWSVQKKTDPNVKSFLERFQEPIPLDPRAALYGGRTAAIRLRHVVSPGERVNYVDFTSLYPFVNAHFHYPLGHPKIIRKDFDSIENYFGLIHAKVYPPRQLFFPVLPIRNDKGKLIFTLCRLCALVNNQTTDCTHNDEERALQGVWVTIEVIEAVRKGYFLAEIYEIWNFEEKSDVLFKDYIYTFLKQKQEASGYPSGVETLQTKQGYIRDYKEKQGIDLDPEKIVYNPAKRQIAKLLLNSLWGKLAQRSNQLSTSLVSTPQRFFEFLFSSKYDISQFHFINDDIALVQWRHNSRCVLPPGDANIFLAAFTTSYARLELYKQLDLLQDRVLYCDTDSIVYTSSPSDQYNPPLGNYLGDLTSELDHGDYICNWSAAGPKSYAYLTQQGKVTLRAKGITQNYENCKKINFDSLTDLVEGYLREPDNRREISTHYNKITRNMKAFELTNKQRIINFAVVYDKRRLLADGKTLPFGY
ncbi:uncharacterized protein LOC129182178 [Dunckerocampus dactyliophorus]|uniref:uncharacterized protein LOC129174692 n=1 Tax=Dunckerocampus dactyliophorus TaxID=161453 RepID=UPI0024063A73|nr:uncharacterized protein LOC129174692 [Dunckerocampus dactyliophorus]XP_054622458.1 uncharacterized protein LOC129174692 [Dunckerocampus dactyliophorus]XP_054622460.1 uncharacterized protein LOC129174692 [Dunckerocampus dactyliophorus]XP_054622469.1 uncharacterized protein LOC129174702 [Dunckerocampus dactyliophorus]XP_054625968.1 uncharacterized protein LOC129178123 isoform X1 [Dunckerocampus dactyliophorus]XP_054625969.1 uncharacterized protein LOC129178123 isoform X1 [Dunckerocampus dacty